MTTAIGDVTCAANCKRAICLLTATTANNSPPAGATAGVPAYQNLNVLNVDTGAFFGSQCAVDSTLLISTSAGSGTMVGTFTLWGYLVASATWYPLQVNSGNALAETATDVIRFRQVFSNLGHFDRLYLELASVGGTATAFEAWLVTGREY